MRKYALKGLEIFHGFLLLSACYCVLMLLTDKQLESSVYKSFLLIPVVGVFSVSVRKVHHFRQYFLLAIVTGTAAVLGTGKGFSGIWMGVCVGTAAISYFIARAKNENCWLDIPAYPWLGIYPVLYLLGSRFECDFLIRYAPLGAGIYFLTVNFYTNLKEMEIFVQTHSSLERLPVKRLGRINQGMMWMLSGITAAVMFASPYLGIDGMIRQASRILRSLIGWLIGLIPAGGGEMMAGAAGAAPEMPVDTAAAAPSFFWVLLYKILDFLGWILAIGMGLLVIWAILKRIYLLYRSFNAQTEENGDKIERLIAAPSAAKKKDLGKGKRENLFWDRSPDARIRKYYKRKVLYDLQEIPPSFWTPSQMEEDVNLSEEDKKKFHAYYEKARYAEENCSREELQEMLNLR